MSIMNVCSNVSLLLRRDSLDFPKKKRFPCENVCPSGSFLLGIFPQEEGKSSCLGKLFDCIHSGESDQSPWKMEEHLV